MGQGRLKDRPVTDGSGMLAITGLEVEGAEIDEIGVSVLAGLEIGIHSGTDFGAGLSGDGDHDDDPGGGACAEPELGEGGDDVLGFRRAVFSEVDEGDIRTRNQLLSC